ncbi:hypothetical protein [Luteolibacter sp. Populi]|uniref:hypothetical protein n=1 Tax=Luteolibacter sp. Populi TaxID=3230487 RepID=UPI003465DBCA
MAGEALPPDVRQLIFQHLSSVEELEILLLLTGEAGKAWTVETTYQRILSSRKSVEKGLEKFAAAGLVSKIPPPESPTYIFDRAAADTTFQELARCYRELPVRVIEAIYQKSRDSAQGFADAFKFKREP